MYVFHLNLLKNKNKNKHRTVEIEPPSTRLLGFQSTREVLARFAREDSFTRQVPLWDRSHGLHVRAKERDALAFPAKKLQQI